MKYNTSLFFIFIVLALLFVSGTRTSIPKIKLIKDLISGKYIEYNYDKEGRLINSSTHDSTPDIQYYYYNNLVVTVQIDTIYGSISIDSFMLDERGLAIRSSHISIGEGRRRTKAWQIKEIIGTKDDTSYWYARYEYDNDRHQTCSKIFNNEGLVEITTNRYDNGNILMSWDSVPVNINFGKITKEYLNIFKDLQNPLRGIYSRITKKYYTHDATHFQTFGANDQGVWFKGANSKNPLTLITTISHYQYPHMNNSADSVIHDTTYSYNSLGAITGTSYSTIYKANISLSTDTVKEYITNRYDNQARIKTRINYKQSKQKSLVLLDSIAVEYY